MRRRRLLSGFLVLLLAAGPAAAKEEPAKNKKEGGSHVELLPVALPIIVDGVLVNYVFVSVRLNLASGADPAPWRAREPVFRDALVRAAHRTPLVASGDYQTIDKAKLSAALLRAAVAVTGPNVIRSVEVIQQVAGKRARPPRG